MEPSRSADPLGPQQPPNLPAWRRRVLQTPRRLLREALTNNLYLKVLSFALAVVLWAMVSEEQDIEESAEVYLELKRPEKLELLTPVPATMLIRVMGSRSKLNQVRSSRLELPIDLSEAKPGETVVSLVGKRIRNLPGGVEVTAYIPASLKLQFDERVTRKLPVKAQLEGEPAAGHLVAGVEISPESVTVVGPRSELKDVREVQTEPIKLTELTRTTEFPQLPLVLNSPHVRVNGGAERVNVKVRIQPVIEQRTFEGVDVVVPETMGRHTLEPATASVVLEGPRDALASIQASDVRIFLQEGTAPLAALHESTVLRYPPPADARGLPRMLVSWPREDVVSLKRLAPNTFKFRLLRGQEASTVSGDRRRR